jgi:hypothetical protein
MILSIAAPASAATWQQPSFLIGGWYTGGTVDTPDTSRLIKLNNAGLDVAVAGDHWTVLGARTFVSQLDALRAQYPTFTMKGIVDLVGTGADTVYAFTQPSKPSVNANFIRQAVSPSFGLNTPSVMGYMVWDEPQGASIDSAALVCNIIASYDSSSTKLPLVNLYPPYVYGDATYNALYSPGTPYSYFNKTTAYFNYVRDYLSSFAPYAAPAAVLSADNYSLQVAGTSTFDFLFTWRTLRDLAGEYGRSTYRIPVSAVIQLSRNTLHDSNPNNPTISQVRLQALEALAYGAKSIMYWLDVPAGDYGEGILTATGAKGARYTSIQTLNRDLHAIGGVLFSCDPVTTWMADSSGDIGVADDVIGSPNIVYNLVTSFTGSAGFFGIASHLKDRNTADDYLLMINKNVSSGISFTVNLANTASTVEVFNRSTGTWANVATNASSFGVNLVPQDGALYRIRDAVAEYIPNVNAMAAAGQRMYFAHQRGLSLVDYATGLRRNVHDGTVYTPEVDVAIAPNKQSVYVAQSNGSYGNVVRWDRNLLYSMAAFIPGIAQPVTAVDAGAGRVLFGVSSASSTGWVYRSDSTLTTRDSVQITDGVNDLKYQPIGDAMIVAHRKGIQRRSNASGLPLLATWQDGTATTPVVRVFVDSVGVVAGLDNGVNGNIQTISSTLWPNQGGWTDGGSFPRIADVVASPMGGVSLLAAVPKTGAHKFSGVTRSSMTQQWSVSATNPKAVAYLGNLDAFMATPAGVLRRSDSGTMYSLYELPPVEGSPAVSFAFDLRPNLIDASHGAPQLRLEARFAGRANWAIYDITGRRVRSGQFDSDRAARERMLDLGDIPAGVYFMRLKQTSAAATRRFVVLR